MMLSSWLDDKLSYRGRNDVGMMLLMTRLGDELSVLRDKAGMSRRVLAELSGLSAGTIQLIESGETEKPEPDTLQGLANGLSMNRALNRVDVQAAAEVYALLMSAAGYSLPPQGTAAIPPARRRRTRSEMRAYFERTYANTDAEGQALIEALLDHLGDAD